MPRAPRIRYRGVDCDGVVTEREVTGFHADVIQHEYDHLDGILYPMRVRDFTLFGFNEELAAAVAAAARQQASARGAAEPETTEPETTEPETTEPETTEPGAAEPGAAGRDGTRA